MYTKARAQKRIALLKCVSGKSFGADRLILLRMYKALIRPILEYAAVSPDRPGSRIIDSLECVQNTALRIATGALRTSPVRSLQVDTNVAPLSLRKQDLSLRFYLKVQGDNRHPCREVIEMESNQHVYEGLSVHYMRRIAGFPASHRLSTMCQELGLRIPRNTVNSRGLIYPWLLPDVNTMMLLDDKRHMTETDIQSAFQDVLTQYPGFRRFYTDGSKTDGSTGCAAFTVNNAFFSHKLVPYMSVFTAELVAIREAL